MDTYDIKESLVTAVMTKDYTSNLYRPWEDIKSEIHVIGHDAEYIFEFCAQWDVQTKAFS